MVGNTSNKVAFDVTIDTLDLMITVFFSKNEYVNPKMKTLIGSFIDMWSPPHDSYEYILRYQIIRYVYAKYEDTRTKEFNQYLSIFDKSQDQDIINDILYELRDLDVSQDQVEFLYDYLVTRLKFVWMYHDNRKMLALANDFAANNFDNLSDMVKHYEEHVAGIGRRFRDVGRSTTDKDTICLNSATFASVMADAKASLSNPRSMMSTGIKGINSLLGGNLESGRLYLFMSVPGGWKSGMLLNIALWTSKYNKDVKTKDPKKKAVVLYLTLENSINETMDRINSYLCNGKSIRETSTHESNSAAAKELNMDQVEIYPVYRKSNTISVGDIEDLYDELASQDKEVVMLVVDYIRRLLPTDPRDRTLNPYEKQGVISTELSNFSKDKDIPVITAAQLNRQADEEIGRAELKGIPDIVALLSRSHIADSRRVMDDTDYAFILYPERHPTMIDQYYLGLKRVKSRGKEDFTMGNTIYIPYERGNKMKLLEDVGTELNHSFSSMSKIFNGETGGNTSNDDREKDNENDKRGKIIKTNLDNMF